MEATRVAELSKTVVEVIQNKPKSHVEAAQTLAYGFRDLLKENQALNDNIQAVQERCTQLIQELRDRSDDRWHDTFKSVAGSVRDVMERSTEDVFEVAANIADREEVELEKRAADRVKARDRAKKAGQPKGA